MARTTHPQNEEGMALIIAVVVLLLLSAIGLSALQNAQSELTSGGHSRGKMRTLYAADAGLGLVRNQLRISTSQYVNRTAIQQTTLLQDELGLFTEIRTGTADNAVPQEIVRIKSVRREGNQVNVNSANTFTSGIYRADVTAVDPTGGTVEIQAQFTVLEGGDSYK